MHRSCARGDACGDVDAGGYRSPCLSDVWYWDLNRGVAVRGRRRSKNRGKRIPIGAGFAGRGRHSLSVLEMLPKDGLGVQAKGIFALWVIGGRAGHGPADQSRDAVLDDAWYAEGSMHPYPVGRFPGWSRRWRGRRGGRLMAERVPRRVRVPGAIGPRHGGRPALGKQFIHATSLCRRGRRSGWPLLGVWSTGWECTHDGQRAGSRTKVPTAAATDTVSRTESGRLARLLHVEDMPRRQVRGGRPEQRH